MLDTDILIVSTARFSPRKNLDRLITAFACLPKERRDVQFHFVGRDLGSAHLVDALNVEFPGRIFYHGTHGHARTYPLVRDAIALIVPSLIENLPNVAIESMLLGTPVIGSHGASIDELVSMNKHCVYFATIDFNEEDALSKISSQSYF